MAPGASTASPAAMVRIAATSVRQRLLHEPEDRELDSGRRVLACAAALVLHGQAGRPDPAEQFIQVSEAG